MDKDTYIKEMKDRLSWVRKKSSKLINDDFRDQLNAFESRLSEVHNITDSSWMDVKNDLNEMWISIRDQLDLRNIDSK